LKSDSFYLFFIPFFIEPVTPAHQHQQLHESSFTPSKGACIVHSTYVDL
jgi:hypothetical protein